MRVSGFLRGLSELTKLTGKHTTILVRSSNTSQAPPPTPSLFVDSFPVTAIIII